MAQAEVVLPGLLKKIYSWKNKGNGVFLSEPPFGG